MQTITVLVRGEDGQDTPKEVKAYKTASPYLFVNHEQYRGEELELWTITHAPTGLAIVQGIEKRKQALKACEDYFSKIYGWGSLTNDNALDFYRENHELLNGGKSCALGLE